METILELKPICSKCKKPNRLLKNRTICTECDLEYHRKYRTKNKIRIDKQAESYASNNAAKIAAYRKEYYLANKGRLKEQKKEYYKNNKNVIIKRVKNYRDSNKKLVAKQLMVRKYSLSAEDYEKMYNVQEGKCKICKTVLPARAHIDHDHSCCPGKASCGKCIRGLLCTNCNTGLGQFKNKIEILDSAIYYLREYARKRIKENGFITAS